MKELIAITQTTKERTDQEVFEVLKTELDKDQEPQAQDDVRECVTGGLTVQEEPY